MAWEKQRSANEGVGGHVGRLGHRARARRAGMGCQGLGQARARTWGNESGETPWHRKGHACRLTQQWQARLEASRAWQGLSKHAHWDGMWTAGPRLAELRGQQQRQESSLSGRPCPADGHLNTDLTPGVAQHSPGQSLASLKKPPMPLTRRPCSARRGPHTGSPAAGLSRPLP